KGNEIVAINAEKNSFLLVPSNPLKWKLNFIKGQKKPIIQGWYSKEYNKKVPNLCAKYQRRIIDTSVTFAWLLYPSEKGRKDVNLKVLNSPDDSYRLQVNIPDENPVKIIIQFQGETPTPLPSNLFLEGRCAILKQNKKP